MTGIASYSTTPASNTTINGINIAEGCPPSGINDAIRQLMADMASQGLANFNVQAADTASAATLNLDALTGNYAHITGTTGITAITLSAGKVFTTEFTGTVAITASGTLIPPGTASYTTAAGDVLVWVGEAAGLVRCIGVIRASGLPLPLLFSTANVWSAVQSFATAGQPLLVNSTGSSTNKIQLQDNGVNSGFLGSALGSYAVTASLAAGTVVGGWDASGNFVPNASSTYNIGSSGVPFKTLFSNDVITSLRKQGSASSTSNTTLTDIPGVSVNLVAGGVYAIAIRGTGTSNVAGGFKIGVGGTATYTSFHAYGSIDNGGAFVGGFDTGSSGVVTSLTATTSWRTNCEVLVTVNAAGTLTAQFAQNASNAAASSLSNVWLIAERIS